MPKPERRFEQMLTRILLNLISIAASLGLSRIVTPEKELQIRIIDEKT
jgi:hypothetical protein